MLTCVCQAEKLRVYTQIESHFKELDEMCFASIKNPFETPRTSLNDLVIYQGEHDEVRADMMVHYSQSS